MKQQRPSIPNPLAVSFGGALRNARGSQTTQTIAKRIRIADSFYRLIESGRNHPSVSKGPAIWHAFDGRLHFDALTMFLASIAASEDRKLVAGKATGRGQYLQANVSSICAALRDAHPFKSFLRRFVSPCKLPPDLNLEGEQDRSVLELVDVQGVDTRIREVVELNGLTEEAVGILCHFSEYDPAARIVVRDYAQQFFGNIPSNYKPMFDGLRGSIQRLPRIFAPEASREWELLNQKGFRELVAICYADPLISYQNLQDYRYEYLWNHEFRTAVFHILDGGEAEALKRNFWTILHKVLEADEATKAIAQEIDVVSAKTVFKPCNETIRNSLLKILEEIESGNTGKPPNAMWFFRTADQALVGAASFISSGTSKSEWIRFLTFDECSLALSRVDSLMRATEG